MEKNRLKEKVQTWLLMSLNDPIIKILLKNSNLTEIQLETLLIDLLSEKISGKDLIYEEKANMRLKDSKISRGSFNRTLDQAKKNAVRSIYTLILLGYLGLFENTVLSQYIEIANKLNKFMRAYKNLSKNKENNQQDQKTINTIHEELKASLKELTNF